MSLKAIKEALDLLKTYIEDNGPCDHSVNICSCGERLALADAKKQIAELEKASPVAVAAFTGDIHVFNSDRIDQCVNLLDAIASEAK